MAKLYQIRCPKCNSKADFYRYGKDSHGHQKYRLISMFIFFYALNGLTSAQCVGLQRSKKRKRTLLLVA